MLSPNIVSVIPLAPVLASAGEFFGFICGGTICLGVCVGIPFLILTRMKREADRGKRYGPTLDEIIEDIPQRKQVLFKGEKIPDWQINARQKATKAVLKFLECTDQWFEKKYISDVADEAFRLVKGAIEARSVRGIENRVTPDCLEELRDEFRRMKKERELHIFGRVEVTDVDVLQVEAPTGKENHSFTALVSAKSRDFFEDDETGELVRGDKKLYAYQEFWTFRRSEKRWLVVLIQPTTDAEIVLNVKNVLAQIDYEEFAKDAKPEYMEHVTAR